MRRDLAEAEDGTTAVEFAMIAPIFIAFMLGMTAYGIYFGAAHSVQQLSADAARVALAGISEAERKQLVAQYIQENSADYLFLRTEAVIADVSANATDPSQSNVSISYDARSLPIWNLYPPLPLPGQTISRTATIRIGGL
ncbi:TadE/TadG family type IV pilus assembly protein [Mesorhizobium australicum]|jgi:Flp pilus assembly protein TadG|uniref:Flp pilus assembly protein TadG n=1 Tax=Mesorhizobium australicum TaxID=536018 RepID=A0A1X7PF04_9HYPH|nr:TadE/TadG family type IV pilus assembly protein [Mesorhizobium australicum]SMH49808.1 Flp pilus assembly protein TadG [Mesorhizobium australicum]